MGAFGYFPAYALGVLGAAQFTAKMRADMPDLDNRVRGDGPAVFTGWLRDNVHVKACLHKPQDLLETVTGERLSARAFKEHLQARYMEGASCCATSAQGEKRRA
jgi:carboxypeptidase Taq